MDKTNLLALNANNLKDDKRTNMPTMILHYQLRTEAILCERLKKKTLYGAEFRPPTKCRIINQCISKGLPADQILRVLQPGHLSGASSQLVL